jgi:hypothetical protein
MVTVLQLEAILPLSPSSLCTTKKTSKGLMVRSTNPLDFPLRIRKQSFRKSRSAHPKNMLGFCDLRSSLFSGVTNTVTWEIVARMYIQYIIYVLYSTEYTKH